MLTSKPKIDRLCIFRFFKLIFLLKSKSLRGAASDKFSKLVNNSIPCIDVNSLLDLSCIVILVTLLISSGDKLLSLFLSKLVCTYNLNARFGKCASSIAMLPAFTSVFLFSSTVLSSATVSFSGVAGVSCFVLSSVKSSFEFSVLSVGAFSVTISSCSLSAIFSCTSAFSVSCSIGTCSVLLSSTMASCTISVFSCAMTGVGSPVSTVVVPIINAELTARTCFFFMSVHSLFFINFLHRKTHKLPLIVG